MRTCCVILLSFYFLCASSQTSLTTTPDQRKVISAFIQNIKNDDREKVANKVRFPLKREYPLPHIESRKDFLLRYDDLFDDYLKKKVIDSDPATDWTTAGWRGLMLAAGDLYLDYDGSLYAITHQSEIEKKKRNELIESEKNYLHPKVMKFNKPVLLLHAPKLIVRVDDMGEGDLRYVSWSNKKMNDMPDVILHRGQLVPLNDGGFVCSFKDTRNLTYKCVITAKPDMPREARIINTKSGAEFLNVEAQIMGD